MNRPLEPPPGHRHDAADPAPDGLARCSRAEPGGVPRVYGNALSRAESDQLYERWAIPAPEWTNPRERPVAARVIADVSQHRALRIVRRRQFCTPFCLLAFYGASYASKYLDFAPVE
jgi:hypothetical protein